MKQVLLKKAGLFLSCILFSAFFSDAYAYDVVVAKDGTGNYTTVQAAVDAAPTNRTTAYTIFIKNGKYKEIINVPSNKPFLQFIGESVANTILTYDNYSGKAIPGGGTYGTSTSASVTINATDFTAINITFENTTGEAPQALAINVNGDRAAFKNCRFLGGQDTVLTNTNGLRNYFKSCYIDGTVDFIFGSARAVFDSCVIYPRTRSSAGNSYITAANTKQTETHGYVFRDCKIMANRGTTAYYLGRPWQNDAGTADAAKSWNKVVFLNTKMSSSVRSDGWSTWDAGTDVTKITYAEYKTKKLDGTLLDISQRVSWSKQFSDADAAIYSNANLFSTWDPCTVTADFCAYQPEPIAVSNFAGVKGSSTSVFNWNISWPMTGIKYELMKSSDKTSFTVINTQTSTNDSSMNFTYSESIPPPGVTYYYIVRASKAGLATHVTDTVAISSTPTISVTGAMGSFIQGLGTPSTSQSYIVSAASLTNNLIITPPTNYELSSNGGTSWSNSSSPIVLVPDGNGNVANTTIAVRLNGITTGTFSGNIVHTSVGATDGTMAVTGTIQAAPLAVSEVLQLWPMATGNADSAALRSAGVIATVPTLNSLTLSNGTTVPAVPAYSVTHGQAFGVSTNGDGTWTTAVGGQGGNLSRSIYEQFTVTASATHSVRLDSLLITSSFYNTSSNTKLAVVYSKTGFVSDSSEIAGATFATPIVVTNETAGTTVIYRLAFSGATGVTLASGQTITYRLYFSCGSGSAGRYGKVKNVTVKGLATLNPVTGDYQTHQTGDWTALNTWERWDGTTWVTPAPAYPVYNNSNTTNILNGHTITVSATLGNGSGYIRRTTIKNGGQLIVNSGASLNIANDGTNTTTDLQVDGAFTLFGGIFSNGDVSVLVNGSFVNSGTGMNLSNTRDTIRVGAAGTYQHNVNNPNTPATMFWQPGSTFLITGITSSQTGIFKSNITYGNIVWNCSGESAYYAFRNTLNSNVQGSFTVANTGSTYISFANASGKITLPGGFYQTGGTVNFRESGTITDTLALGSDFNISGGAFNSNSAAGTSLLMQLSGVNKTINYSLATATNTNWNITGSYTLASNLAIPTAAFGMTVDGTLNTSTFAVSGAGNFTLSPAAFLSSGASTGIDGNVTVSGTKSLSTAANYIFNGTSAQATGTTLPATINALTINNTTNVSLTNVTDVTSSFTLANGKLILGSASIIAPSVLSSTLDRYVVTDANGVLKIKNVGAGSTLYPVGSSTTSYNPVTLNNTGNIANISVKVSNSFTYAVPDANKVVNKQWQIVDGASGANVAATFSWLTADQAAGFNPAAAIASLRHNGTSWVESPAVISGSGAVATPYVVTLSGINNFGFFAIANSSALPLHLGSFTASDNGTSVGLAWATTNEINVKDFTIERSSDGVDFSAIGTVAANNVSGINNYGFADQSPLNGIGYYRLKINDKDGTHTYSIVISINRSSLFSKAAYPNPVKNSLVVTHAKAKIGDKLEVVGVDGKILQTITISLSATQTKIDVSKLANGSYLVAYNSTGKRSAIQFIKQ